MNTDRELLELAAKAAGITILRSRLDDPMWRDMLLAQRHSEHAGIAVGWNPLTSDGDAHQLGAKLRISVLFQHDWLMAYRADYTARERDLENVGVSLRRAIVRVAAEIGKDMP